MSQIFTGSSSRLSLTLYARLQKGKRHRNYPGRCKIPICERASLFTRVYMMHLSYARFSPPRAVQNISTGQSAPRCRGRRPAAQEPDCDFSIVGLAAYQALLEYPKIQAGRPTLIYGGSTPAAIRSPSAGSRRRRPRSSSRAHPRRTISRCVAWVRTRYVPSFARERDSTEC